VVNKDEEDAANIGDEDLLAILVVVEPIVDVEVDLPFIGILSEGRDA
jgi:hypothetical protein